jgi:hypothetical protein
VEGLARAIAGELRIRLLKGLHRDVANVILSAVGYNLRLILRWLRALLCSIAAALSFASPAAARA